MKYEYHNFNENFKAIQNTKDMGITRELMLSEVAKVIEGRPALVKKALIECGVSVSSNAGKRELVKAVSYNLVSKCVRVSIMKLVLSNQLPFIQGADKTYGDTRERVSDFDTDISESAFMNQTGTTPVTPTNTGGGITGGDALGAGVQLFGTIAGIWQGNKGYKEMSKNRAHELTLAQMNQDLMLKQMNLSANQTVAPPTQAGLGGGSMVTYILLGIGVVAIIGFSIYSSRGRGSRPAPVMAPIE